MTTCNFILIIIYIVHIYYVIPFSVIHISSSWPSVIFCLIIPYFVVWNSSKASHSWRGKKQTQGQMLWSHILTEPTSNNRTHYLSFNGFIYWIHKMRFPHENTMKGLLEWMPSNSICTSTYPETLFKTHTLVSTILSTHACII